MFQAYYKAIWGSLPCCNIYVRTQVCICQGRCSDVVAAAVARAQIDFSGYGFLQIVTWCFLSSLYKRAALPVANMGWCVSAAANHLSQAEPWHIVVCIKVSQTISSNRDGGESCYNMTPAVVNQLVYVFSLFELSRVNPQPDWHRLRWIRAANGSHVFWKLHHILGFLEEEDEDGTIARCRCWNYCYWYCRNIQFSEHLWFVFERHRMVYSYHVRLIKYFPIR